MGVAASVTPPPSPLATAIQQGLCDQVMHIIKSGSLVNKPITGNPNNKTPLVYAVSCGQYDIVTEILEHYNDVINGENLDNALDQALTQVQNISDAGHCLVLLKYGANVNSPLKLLRCCITLATEDITKMEEFIRLVMECSYRVSVQGAMLTSLCNSRIRIRAKLPEEMLSEQCVISLVQYLFEEGAEADSYWFDGFSDLCLQGGTTEIRYFKPVGVTKIFIQSTSNCSTLCKVVQCSSMFNKACDDVAHYICLLVWAGYFNSHRYKLSHYEICKLTDHNILQSERYDSFKDLFDSLYREPRTLLQLALQSVRKALGTVNVFYGVNNLTRSLPLPGVIRRLLLLQNIYLDMLC